MKPNFTFFFSFVRLVASPGLQGWTLWSPKSRSLQWSTARIRWRVMQTRWVSSPTESRRTWTERRTITSGEVTFLPASTLPISPLLPPLPLNALSVLQILHPRCPASSPRPGSCLPSTGCAEWRGRRKDKTIQWRLRHLNRQAVSYRKNHAWSSS